MNGLQNFRLINHKENSMIKDSLLKYSPNFPSVLEELNYHLFILLNDFSSNNDFPLIYLVPSTLINTLSSFNSDINIISSGIYFGFIKKNKFYLSIEGAEFLHTKKCFSKRFYVKVDSLGEKSILYGNNVKNEQIIEISKELTKNDLLIVTNQSNELIALAQLKANYKNFQNLKPKDIIALNLVDKGSYLRKKQ